MFFSLHHYDFVFIRSVPLLLFTAFGWLMDSKQHCKQRAVAQAFIIRWTMNHKIHQDLLWSVPQFHFTLRRNSKICERSEISQAQRGEDSVAV